MTPDDIMTMFETTGDAIEKICQAIKDLQRRQDRLERQQKEQAK